MTCLLASVNAPCCLRRWVACIQSSAHSPRDNSDRAGGWREARPQQTRAGRVKSLGGQHHWRGHRYSGRPAAAVWAGVRPMVAGGGARSHAVGSRRREAEQGGKGWRRCVMEPKGSACIIRSARRRGVAPSMNDSGVEPDAGRRARPGIRWTRPGPIGRGC